MDKMNKSLIYLVPGFFGFKSLGSLNYFHRVSDSLSDALRRLKKDCEIIECMTQPTGSITRRADRLLQTIVDTGGLEADEIHLVGHSTGGLDIRLLLSPGVKLRSSDEEELIAKRVLNSVSISTPHYGTPLAGFFTTVQGRQILQVLTLLATTSTGRRTIYLAAKVLSRLTQMDDFLGLDKTFLDALATKLFHHITMEEADPLWVFINEVSSDQGAIVQLTPEGMHLFNAAVVERTDVRYTSIVTSAPPPFAQSFRDFLSPTRAVLCVLYGFMHKLVGRQHRHYPYPAIVEKYENELIEKFPFPFNSMTNDAVVPAQSQLYGELLDVVVGDHLDVVGQFRMAGGSELSDWLPSGSRFDEERFRNVWKKVASVIAEQP